jgi:hypothetical protein
LAASRELSGIEVCGRDNGRMKRMRGIRIDWRGQEKERANSMSSGVPNRGAKKRIKT